MPKTIEELNQFMEDYISKNLTISVDRTFLFGGDETITIKLVLNSKVIHEDYFTIYND